MKKEKRGSISLKRVIGISIIVVIILGISVIAGNVKVNNVKIRFANNHEITVLTSKTKVSEILEENHIILASDEIVTPTKEENITSANTIIISTQNNEQKNIEVADKEEVKDNITDIAQNYENIVEEIQTVQEEIPFETITKDVSNQSGETTNKIIQIGRNGIREVTYKVKYKDEVEISREEVSSKVIKDPVNQIVQIQTVVVTSRSTSSRTESSTAATTATSGRYKVTAYCSCAKCCGKTNGMTASGVKATSDHTIAAPGTFAFGTKLKINGEIYTVEDRGGAIQGNRIDIYMDSHAEAMAWGVRYLDVEVLN
jgi:3D (Asp-Asp-Asp) domain-containing protein